MPSRFPEYSCQYFDDIYSALKGFQYQLRNILVEHHRETAWFKSLHKELMDLFENIHRDSTISDNIEAARDINSSLRSLAEDYESEAEDAESRCADAQEEISVLEDELKKTKDELEALQQKITDRETLGLFV